MNEEELYEERITDILADSYEAVENARRFKAATEQKKIAIKELCDIFNVPTAGIVEYVDMETGEFLEGKEVETDVIDDLKDAILELDMLPRFRDQADADRISSEKLEQAKVFIREVREVLQDRTNEVVSRARQKAKERTDFEF